MHLMPISIFFFVLPIAIMVMLALPRRVRMERRARALRMQHPHAEQTSIYFAFRSWRAKDKEREMDGKIAEMQSDGWTFLRAKEANPLRTILTWNGGLTLQFIRP